MRKTIIILSILAIIISGCRQRTENKEKTASDENIAGQGEYVPIAGNQGKPEFSHTDQTLISLFPDMTLGKYMENSKPIPKKLTEKYFSDILIPREDVERYLSDKNEEYERMYAVGKIMNYNGLDLLLCTYESENVLGSDNHTGFHRYLFFFKDGVPFADSENPSKQLLYTMDYHYLGEGGETVFKSYFDTDTTIVSHLSNSESESATGYSTPLISTEEYRWRIKKNRKKEILEITKKEFSSPFYDRNFLNTQQWMIDVKNERIPYPTKENRWNLNINNLHYNNFPLINPSIELYFYVKDISGELIPIFETYRDENLIDNYAVGQPRDNKSIEKNQETRNKILKSPIIIKTSDGDLELLPNGKLVVKERK